MKRTIYIFLLVLQLFTLLSGCDKPSLSQDITYSVPEESPTLVGRSPTKAVTTTESAVTTEPTVTLDSAVTKSTSIFRELRQIQLKDRKAISVLQKDNTFYLTVTTPDSINTTLMKELICEQNSISKLLINKDNPLPKDFSPKDLTPISASKVNLEYPNLKLIPCTIDALYSMVAAAKEDGIKEFIINSAYRSIYAQQLIFNSNLDGFKKTSKTYEEALSRTRQLVALPGNSEHHTGLSLDIFSVNGRHRNDFEGTKEQVWLDKNLYRFGFIIRYPSDKTLLTGSVYEPWHIRYVGVSLSSYLAEYNLCLEEFYEKISKGEVLENSKSVFIGAERAQKVYIDPELMKYVSLEIVNSDNLLLTIDKSSEE